MTMIKQRAQLPSCLRQLGWRTLPEVDQRIRVVMRSEMELWQGSRRIRFNPGESYEGTITSVTDEGLIDLATTCGRSMRFYMHDTAFQIQVVA